MIGTIKMMNQSKKSLAPQSRLTYHIGMASTATTNQPSSRDELYYQILEAVAAAPPLGVSLRALHGGLGVRPRTIHKALQSAKRLGHVARTHRMTWKITGYGALALRTETK